MAKNKKTINSNHVENNEKLHLEFLNKMRQDYHEAIETFQDYNIGDFVSPIDKDDDENTRINPLEMVCEIELPEHYMFLLTILDVVENKKTKSSYKHLLGRIKLLNSAGVQTWHDFEEIRDSFARAFEVNAFLLMQIQVTKAFPLVLPEWKD